VLVISPDTLDVEPRHPQVLHSEDSQRTIAIALTTGEQLQEHQTRERAYVLVVVGRVAVAQPDGSTVTLGPGGGAIFEPGERRELTAEEDAKLVMLLTPWPAPDHQTAR